MELASIVSWIVLMGLVWVVAFFALSAFVWALFFGVALLIISFCGHLPIGILLLFWLIYLAVAAFANLHSLRQRYLVHPFVAKLKKQLPTISATERAAIEAGDTWWEKDLFCGRPNFEKLFNMPKPTLTNEEQDFLNHQVETVCSMINDWEIVNNQHDLSEEVWAYLKKERFFGMVIPKAYGGHGFSALAHSTVVTKIATRSSSAAVTTMVPNSLGPAALLLHYGTEEQKNDYLPRLATGLEIPCFALTGPDAGSDAGDIADSGIVCRDAHDGQEVIGIRLNWNKRYITLAPIATVLGLAIHLYDPEHLLGPQQDLGITLCLIPTTHPGVEIGSRHYPMRLAFMNGPTFGKDVFIPLNWIIGGQPMIGQGWRMLMECLSIGRAISLPALATGSVKTIYRVTGAYARIRQQFNTAIANFEGVQEGLGYIAGSMYQLEACRVMTAGAVDLKINPAIVSAISKCHMTEICRQVIAHGMDIHAGHMIQAGPRNCLAGLHEASPISITVEGANILTRHLIIFGQGAIRCHPYLLDEVALLSAFDTDVAALDHVLMKHVGYFTSNMLRAFGYGLTCGVFIFANVKDRRVKKWQRQITRMSAALAFIADASLMLLGGSLKRRERLSARLGDILSQLYLASATLKYFSDQGQPDSDVKYVSWALQQNLYKIQIAFNELFANFPKRFLGSLMKALVFPFGNAYMPPCDQLHSEIIAPMLTLSALRDRLTQYMYLAQDDGSLTFKLDQALAQIDMIEPLWKKIQKASHGGKIAAWQPYEAQIEAAVIASIITADEASKLKAFETLRTEIIRVNEFSFDLKEIIT